MKYIRIFLNAYVFVLNAYASSEMHMHLKQIFKNLF